MANRLIGLGCMRLSTAAPRDEEAAVAVIHAALDGGVRLLDTADSYCLDESERGHNERLIARSLRTWSGDRSAVKVATKGGLRRPGGRWVPDGRAKYLREACEASCRALDVDRIDLYQFHVVDPRTRLETSLRALAALQEEDLIERVGLCNVTVGQIEAARNIVDVSAVQVSLSVLDEENLRNGVAEHCIENGIQLIAYRPLGGSRSDRLGRDPALVELAAKRGATPHEIALAWLLELDHAIVPIPGATRTATARSIGQVTGIRLSSTELERLDARFPAGRLLRVPRSVRRPPDDADGQVIIVMGMPGAGKSSAARELVASGYERLNRDQRGGRLSSLVSALDDGISTGHRHWVLDNTYPSRSRRNEVIECAWRHGVPARCVWLDTSLADAQINAIGRMIGVHGRLPTVDELKAMGRTDARYFGPDAQFRYERQLEPPTLDEGFQSIERRAFQRRPSPNTGRALVLEYDDVLCTSGSSRPVALEPSDVCIDRDRRENLLQYEAQGWSLFALAWRPQVGAGETDDATVRSTFERTREVLGTDIDFAYCPHAAGPPVCWCRKPLPGLVLEFASRRGIDLERSTLVGRSPSDRTMAERLAMSYFDQAAWFGAGE